MFHIGRFDFNNETATQVSKLHHGKTEVGSNWPVVYVINNDEEAYVGETVHAFRRIEQHQQTKERQRLTEIRIISDDNFNKSVVLDLESFLIKYMSSDEKFILQNGNGGISDHEYFDRSAYRDCHQMYEDIRRKNDEMGLCRMAAGYAWPWDRKKPDEYTIEVQGHKYRWNRVYDNWITTKTAPEEIGCIHTLQGYDLNYAGIIIGNDIKYDAKAGKIVSDKSCYYDTLGKAGVSDDPEGLKNYLCNIYITLLTRGIRGTYIYVCDDALREHLEEYFPVEG